MAMTISVIIPTLNEERTIMATMAHTANFGFDELIVADGVPMRRPHSSHPIDSDISPQHSVLYDWLPLPPDALAK